MSEWLGWVATAIFAASYFCSRPAPCAPLQAARALLWIGYGVIIGAPPVIVANAVVAGAALWSLWRSRPSRATAPRPARPRRAYIRNTSRRSRLTGLSSSWLGMSSRIERHQRRQTSVSAIACHRSSLFNLRAREEVVRDGVEEDRVLDARRAP